MLRTLLHHHPIAGRCALCKLVAALAAIPSEQAYFGGDYSMSVTTEEMLEWCQVLLNVDGRRPKLSLDELWPRFRVCLRCPNCLAEPRSWCAVTSMPSRAQKSAKATFDCAR